MIAESAVTAAPSSRLATSSRTQPVDRRGLLGALAAFIERAAQAPASANESDRYWTSVARGL
jgi:hypothetical protein